MTKYNLEEFKRWLEERPERREGLPHWNVYSLGSIGETIITDNFEVACQQGTYDPNTLRPYHQVVLKWKTEIDEKQKHSYENLKKISKLVLLNDNFDFSALENEIKRLKIQDLNIQIPLKKQELEQLTNSLKNNLGSSAKYLLDKLLKKQKKLLQNNENTSDKLEEMKQALREELNNQGNLQNLLNKQKELFSLEKHLESLQNEQVAQIVNNPPRNN